jgi:hypothetical protein
VIGAITHYKLQGFDSHGAEIQGRLVFGESVIKDGSSSREAA